MRLRDLVSGWMSERPVTIEADRPIVEAFAAMAEHGVRHLPVYERGRLIGMLSNRDLYRAVPARDQSPDEALEVVRALYTCRVGELIAEQELVAVEPMTTVIEAAQLMLAHKVSALPVIDSNALVGIITTHDLLKELIEILTGRDPDA